MSRDRSGESGGINLYGFISNSPINKIDILGLYEASDVTFQEIKNYLVNQHHLSPDTALIWYSQQKAETRTWVREQIVKEHGPQTIFEIFENTDFSKAPPPSNATYWGAEILFYVVGTGVTEVTCCDKNKTKFTFNYRKVCYGAGVGVGAVKGEIKGMETCDHEDYNGWFLEFGLSAGVVSVGIDLSFQNSTITLPFMDKPLPNLFKLGKVKEAGGGLSKGWEGKLMFCYYTYDDTNIVEPVKCGCDNAPK